MSKRQFVLWRTVHNEKFMRLDSGVKNLVRINRLLTIILAQMKKRTDI